MTSPAGAKANPAPNGYKQDGSVSDSLDNTRDDMISEFEAKVKDLDSNTQYYEGQARPEAIGISTPQEMRKLDAKIGYPRIFVDAISDRLEVEGFRLGDADKSDDDIWSWWQVNDLDIQAPLGHTDALTHGRSYVTISAPDPKVDINWDPKVPIIRVEGPTSLYARIDTRTRQIQQAIRVIYDADGSQVTAATLYLPLQTVAWIKQDGEWAISQQVPHNLGVVPVVPIPNQLNLKDLYGTTQITPEIRSATDAAARIMHDMQGAAALMATPQRLLFGVKPEEIGVDSANGLSRFDAYMARILAFADPEGKAFQFAAAELRNFGDALDKIDQKVASYTGLPASYLAQTSINPASAEAIEAVESRFVKLCERKTVMFGGAWEQVMRIAKAVMGGGMQTLSPDDHRMESIWRDPSTPTFAAKADATTKLYGGGQGLIPKKQARRDMGYSLVAIEQMELWDQEEATALLGAFGVSGNVGALAGAPGDTGTSAVQQTKSAQIDATKPVATQTKTK